MSKKPEKEGWRKATVTFDEHLPDSYIRALFGPDNIVSITRLGEFSEIEVYTDLPDEILRERVRTSANTYASGLSRKREKNKVDYIARIKTKLSRNAPCEPVTRMENGAVQDGFRYLDDDGEWKYIWVAGL